MSIASTTPRAAPSSEPSGAPKTVVAGTGGNGPSNGGTGGSGAGVTGRGSKAPLHPVDDIHPTLPTAGPQTAVPTAFSSTTVARSLPARSRQYGWAALSPSVFAMLFHELEDFVHTLEYFFPKDHHRPHSRPPSPQKCTIACLHVRRLLRPPLPRLIQPVALSSVVFFPLLLACFSFFLRTSTFVYLAV